MLLKLKRLPANDDVGKIIQWRRGSGVRYPRRAPRDLSALPTPNTVLCNLFFHAPRTWKILKLEKWGWTGVADIDPRSCGAGAHDNSNGEFRTEVAVGVELGRLMNSTLVAGNDIEFIKSLSSTVELILRPELTVR